MSKVRIKNRKFKIASLFFLGVILLGGIFAGEYFLAKDTEKIKKANVELDESISPTKGIEIPANVSEKNDIPDENTIPDKFLIEDVPFMVQAPFGRWDEIHEEACEEASIVMLEYFKKNKKLTPEIAEKEIQGLVAYQIKTRGDFKDSNADQIAKLARDYYGLELEVVRDFKKDKLRDYLAEKRPIIIPAAGRLLGNPFFTSPGPLYHNLVLVGYDGDTIITNDPGTKRGEGYKYNIDIIYEAIHDFPGKKEDINEGQKAILVLK